MTKKKLGGAATAASLVTVLLLSALYLFVPMKGGYNWLGWILVVLNLFAGPCVLIAYIVEVRRGVFRDVGVPQDTPEQESDSAPEQETEE